MQLLAQFKQIMYMGFRATFNLLISQQLIRFLSGTRFLSLSHARCHVDQFTFYISLQSIKFTTFLHLSNSHINCLQTSMMKIFNLSQRRFLHFGHVHLCHAHSLHGRDTFEVFYELHIICISYQTSVRSLLGIHPY